MAEKKEAKRTSIGDLVLENHPKIDEIVKDFDAHYKHREKYEDKLPGDLKFHGSKWYTTLSDEVLKEIKDSSESATKHENVLKDKVVKTYLEHYMTKANKLDFDVFKKKIEKQKGKKFNEIKGSEMWEEFKQLYHDHIGFDPRDPKSNPSFAHFIDQAIDDGESIDKVLRYVGSTIDTNAENAANHHFDSDFERRTSKYHDVLVRDYFENKILPEKGAKVGNYAKFSRLKKHHFYDLWTGLEKGKEDISLKRYGVEYKTPNIVKMEAVKPKDPKVRELPKYQAMDKAA